jgi:DNA-binding transcriptional ArsR family regulator
VRPVAERRTESKRWHGVHRALADPLRIRIVEALWETPRSAREVAECLELPADRLYYHLAQLEQAGLVEVAEYRRLARGKVERVYAPAEVEPPDDAADPEEMVAFLGSMLDATRADITAAYRAKQDGRHREVDLYRGAVRLTEQALTELRGQIQRLVATYADCTDAATGSMTTEGEDGAVWTRLVVALVDLQNREVER